MKQGLLVMAYGSPTSPEHIEAYYTDIRRGRPPSAEQLANLVDRYGAIGGTSALAERTAEQVRALEAALNPPADPAPGDDRGWVVALGTKHSSPSIADGLERLVDAGATSIVGLVLAPHYSDASVGDYHRRALAALDETTSARSEQAIGYRRIDSWHSLDALLDFHAQQIRERLATMPDRTKVVFTAHSLPERVLTDDPYPDELHGSAAAAAARAGLSRWAGWGLGWQSAGATPEPWRGPDLLQVIDDLAATGRSDAILVVPHGFTSEHLEVLYDLDIQAAERAARVDLAFARTSPVNDDPTVMAALASVVRDTDA